LRRFAGAKQGHPGAARLGGERQAPQLLVARVWKPREQRMAAARTQHLLGSPQRIAPPGRAHQRELGEIDACGRQRRRVRQVRRRKPYDALARPGERRQRRQNELQLADAFAVAEDLAQRAGRPAAARQLAVKRGKAGRDRGRRAGKRAAAPDGVPLEDLFEGRHRTVFIYSIEPRGKHRSACRSRSNGEPVTYKFGGTLATPSGSRLPQLAECAAAGLRPDLVDQAQAAYLGVRC